MSFGDRLGYTGFGMAYKHKAPPNRPPLDIERVGRALTLQAIPLDDKGSYRIVGDRDDYYVQLEPHYSCDCGDFTWRDNRVEVDAKGVRRRVPLICKHICSALIEAGDIEALELLYRYVEREKKREKAETR